jgi:homogentisate 1,2-dioxygenase
MNYAGSQHTTETRGYMSGFGNSFETEALPGTLPVGRNSPQRCAYGLYAEQLSGSPFTAPRGTNERSWLYRIRPSVKHSGRFTKVDAGLWRTAPCHEEDVPLAQLRWDPTPMPTDAMTFLQGVRTMTTAGDVHTQTGMAAHVYLITRSMIDQHFYNADGEMMFVLQKGDLRFVTEFGRIDAQPGEIVVVPRGVKFRVEIFSSPARGYLCENYGGAFTLPERGPIGANCLANSRDFLTPIAAYEDKETPTELFVKWGGSLYKAELTHSPIDVVGWHGNYAPYKYDLRAFSPVGAISFDHPDPSIFTVLTSPSETAGTANIDFVIFPERWMVADNTFRPALVSHEHHVGVHGAGIRPLRCEATGLCAGRHESPQLYAAARPRPPSLRARQYRRSEACQVDGYLGLHVRNTLSATCHKACCKPRHITG